MEIFEPLLSSIILKKVHRLILHHIYHSVNQLTVLVFGRLFDENEYDWITGGFMISNFRANSQLSMLLLLLLVVPAALAWDPAEGDVPWQPEEIALFELVS